MSRKHEKAACAANRESGADKSSSQYDVKVKTELPQIIKKQETFYYKT
jgi:hypothetical protein